MPSPDPNSRRKDADNGSAVPDKMVVRESSGGLKPVRRSFPGPRNAEAALRVAIEGPAYAGLVAHATESLNVEVCGVLAGQVCEDENGVYVHVEVAIRGTAAAEGSTHVTFTQTTWNTIHKILERDYPKLRIVGWYHTHPGFGVEFSEMDLFIQNNFFSSPTQIALVTDPLSGALAILINTPPGPRYLPRCWVDGREHACNVPKHAGAPAESGPHEPAAAIAADAAPGLQSLEARLGQLIQAHDDLRASYHGFLMFCGVVFCVALIVAVGYFVYSQKISRVEPPRVNQVVPVPIQVGDKAVILGVGITSWEVPPELNALLLQEMQRQKAAAEEAAKKAGTNAPAAGAGTNTATGGSVSNAPAVPAATPGHSN